jgi:hypothetical protein
MAWSDTHSNEIMQIQQYRVSDDSLMMTGRARFDYGTGGL